MLNKKIPRHQFYNNADPRYSNSNAAKLRFCL